MAEIQEKEFLDRAGAAVLVEEIKKRPTKTEMQEAIAAAQLEGEDIDLSGYAKTEDVEKDYLKKSDAEDAYQPKGNYLTSADIAGKADKTELEGKADKSDLNNHINDTAVHVTADEKEAWLKKSDAEDTYQPKGEYQAKGDYPTKTEMQEAIEDAQLGGEDVDLSEYAKTEDVAANYQPKGDYLTAADIADKADKSELNTKADKTELEDKADKSDLNSHINNTTVHVTADEKSAWDGKQDEISDLATIRSNASNGQTAYGWGNHATAGYIKDGTFVTQVKVGSTAYDPSSGVVSLPAYPTVPTKVQGLTKSVGTATTSGAISFNGSTYDVYVVTLNGNVSGITLSTRPAKGHECTVILYSASTERTVVIANSGIYKTPTGENLELTVPAGGYAEVNMLFDGTNVWVRGV